jgi:phage gpG-like protein
MNFEVQITESDFPEITDIFDRVKVSCQDAMAGRFAEICRENIGLDLGTNRPDVWPPLSPRYAQRVGRDEATLFVTGNLFNSIQTKTGDYDCAECFSDSPYAIAHQEGDESKNLPARPFFPISQGGFITPFAESECLRVCRDELQRQLA